MTTSPGLSRRKVLAAAAATAAVPLAAGDPARASGPKTYDLTVLGTSDTHGNV